jgi:uncharacterized protein YqcC (DUF446 family)
MYQQTHAYLLKLKGLLKKYQLWQNEPISPKALQSTVPFCHDTLVFEQWLQFVFIEKVQNLIDQRQPLPRNFAIAPMAQMMLIHKKGGDEIIKILSELDTFLGANNE